jgi:membrane-associated phospholipid phosphatase
LEVRPESAGEEQRRRGVRRGAFLPRAAAVLTLLLPVSFPAAGVASDGIDCPAIDASEDPAPQDPPPGPRPSFPKLVGSALWEEVKRYGEDTEALVVAPLHWDSKDIRKAAGAAVLIGGAFAADPTILEAFERNRSEFTNRVSQATTWFGSPGALYLSLGLVAGGLVAGNDDLRDMGRDAVEASILTGLITSLIVKPVAGRWRPDESDGKTIFEPFSGHDSFTSGHATQAFAVASVVAMRSPGWVIPTIAYGLATVVACDRINDNVHFASDVIAGALFATATGRFLVNRHRGQSIHESKAPKVTFEVIPISDGLALRARW